MKMFKDLEKGNDVYVIDLNALFPQKIRGKVDKAIPFPYGRERLVLKLKAIRLDNYEMLSTVTIMPAHFGNSKCHVPGSVVLFSDESVATEYLQSELQERIRYMQRMLEDL